MIFEYVISFFIGKGGAGSFVRHIKGYFYIDEKSLGSKKEDPCGWWKRYGEAIENWENILTILLSEKMHEEFPYVKVTFLDIKTTEANQNRDGWNITSIEDRKVEE